METSTLNLLTDQATIVAPATAAGRGGIAIIRISGEGAWAVGQKLFRPSGGLDLGDVRAIPPRKMLHGWVINPTDQTILDEVLAVFFLKPHSYTTEDCLELQSHGGPVVQHLLMEQCLALGCRLARPGEFTLRALRGGRLDLSQAEAVAEIVAARAEGEARLAQTSLAGGLSRLLAPMRRALLEAAALIEVGLDFPDDFDLPPGLALSGKLLAQVLEPLQKLLRDSQAYRFHRQGALVVLAGPPNAGKSSLFNALLGAERALVSAHPGTTRDSLQEELRLGQEVTRRHLRRADAAVLLLDGAKTWGAEEEQAYDMVAGLPHLLLANKADLPQQIQGSFWQDKPVMGLSARTQAGLPRFLQALASLLTADGPEPEPDQAVASRRQQQCLAVVREHVQRAQTHLDQPDPPWELAAADLSLALAELGLVDGQGAPHEVINEIFANFCLGK